MNGYDKPFRYKSNPKKSKKGENRSEIAACEQKTTSEKANFCSNTIFSLYFEFRAKKFHAAKPLAFSLHFLFRRDQNHYSKLTSKIMKMCEQIFKKKTAPQYNSNSLKCKKNHDVPNNCRYRLAAITKKTLLIFSIFVVYFLVIRGLEKPVAFSIFQPIFDLKIVTIFFCFRKHL